MPAIAREKDPVKTGHGCTTVTTILAKKTTGNAKSVTAGGLGVACKGDVLTNHSKPSGSGCGPHNKIPITEGSKSVTVGGKAVARVGDAADAGKIIGGLGTVTVGG